MPSCCYFIVIFVSIFYSLFIIIDGFYYLFLVSLLSVQFGSHCLYKAFTCVGSVNIGYMLKKLEHQPMILPWFQRLGILCSVWNSEFI